MSSRESLTISLEATKVRMMVMRGKQILRGASAPLPAGVMHNGQVAQPTPFGQVVAKLIEQVDGPRRKAIVSLSGQQSIVRILSLPAVPSHLLDEAVRREARRELPLPPEELYLSWRAIDNHNTTRIRVFTLGVPRQAVDNCVVGLHNAGVRPVAMDLKPLALVRAVNLPDVLIADVEVESGCVVLVRDFVPHIVRSIALPGEGTRSLAERANHQVAEIQRTLDFSESVQAAGHSPRRFAVCLTGLLGAEKEIREQVGARWSLVEPDPPLSLPKALPLLPYLVNVGLGLKCLL